MPAPRNKTAHKDGNVPMPRHENCWAKTTKDAQGREIPGINVRDHCLNVGCVAEALLNLLPKHLRNLLPPSVPTLAALHDIGKVSLGFQQKCPAWLGEHGLSAISTKQNWCLSETHHGKVTAFALRDYFRSRWGDGSWEDVAHCVGAHHGTLFGKLFAKQPKKDPTAWAAQARRELIEELERVRGDLPKQPARLLESDLWYLAGLITVADWIGSDERFFSPDRSPMQRTKAAARADARRALTEIGWRTCRLRPGLTFKDLFGFNKASDLQVRAANVSEQPRVALIEASMGAGKTEAALALAYRLMEFGTANGLYFALPTQVTSNRIHLRVRAFLQRAVAQSALLRLAHANSWLRDNSCSVVAPAGRDDKTPVVARQWFASAKRALLALYGVGTIDQALLGVVAAKHFFVRQFALAGKVVIVDEVHSYDLYTGTLVDHLVRQLRQLGATVVILSATLTAERKRELLGLPKRATLDDSYPLLSVVPKGRGNLIQLRVGSEEPKQVAVRCVELAEADAVAECLRRAEGGECVLWIRNTVAEAQAAFRHLRSDRCGDEPMVALLHSRFPHFRREQLERLWLTRLGKDPRRRPHGCVLVATQVVEQSVDVDADFLLTDLAPTDMLLQRIGRLWRHQERPDMAARRPATARREIWVKRPDLADADDAGALKRALGRSAKVYAPYVLLRSLTEWLKLTEQGALELPRDIRPLLEATYAKPAPTEPKSWTSLRRELQQRRAELKDHAEAVTRVWSMEQLDDEEGVQTRWSKFETGWLLLVRKARVRRDELELEPLRGRPFTVQARKWTIDAAKRIHQNLVRVDAWMIHEGYGYLPDALRDYMRGRFALGILKGDRNGPIGWPGQQGPSRLYYHEDIGVEIQPKRKETNSWQPSVDDDESYD
jgi:CRISPR-associated endonuclease/helicase Cas3